MQNTKKEYNTDMKKIWKQIGLVWIIILSLGIAVFLYQKQNYIATIIIDPGHGGYDVGSVASDGTTYEKTMTLDYGLQIGKEIQKINPKIHVIYTRTSDYVPWPADEKLDLRYRIQQANQEEADFYLSIHMNASLNTEATGYSFHIQEEDPLAYTIAQQMETNLEKISWSHSRGIVYTSKQPLYVVDQFNHSAMLLETGFITNEEEFENLNSYSNKKKIARAVAKAICDSFQN